MPIRMLLIAAAGAVLMLGACAAASPGAQTPSLAAPSVVRLPATAGREIDLRVWTAHDPQAVIVFSAGGGGEPVAYDRLMRALAKQGFTVVAPIHRDPLSRGDLSGAGGPQSFIVRVEDLAFARGYVEATQPGLPLVVMGHSFGSLMSSLAAGASTPAGVQTAPAVKAIVAFSSPGLVPGLVTPDTYRSLDRPVLMVTGDRDVVPGFASDWRDHRAMYDDSAKPGSALAVFEDGDHSLIVDADDAAFATLIDLTSTFIRASALADPRARDKLAATTPAGATLYVR